MLSIKQEQENLLRNSEASSLVKQLVDIEILYLITSRIKSESNAGGTAIVKVEQLQFVSTEV